MICYVATTNERLAELILSKGLRPADFADLIDVPRATAYAWLNGRRKLHATRPDHRALVSKISRTFNVPEDEIWGTETAPMNLGPPGSPREMRLGTMTRAIAHELLDLLTDPLTPNQRKDRIKLSLESLFPE